MLIRFWISIRVAIFSYVWVLKFGLKRFMCITNTCPKSGTRMQANHCRRTLGRDVILWETLAFLHGHLSHLFSTSSVWNTIRHNEARECCGLTLKKLPRRLLTLSELKLAGLSGKSSENSLKGSVVLVSCLQSLQVHVCLTVHLHDRWQSAIWESSFCMLLPKRILNWTFSCRFPLFLLGWLGQGCFHLRSVLVRSHSMSRCSLPPLLSSWDTRWRIHAHLAVRCCWSAPSAYLMLLSTGQDSRVRFPKYLRPPVPCEQLASVQRKTR